MFKIITMCPVCHAKKLSDKAEVTEENVIYTLDCGHKKALPKKVPVQQGELSYGDILMRLGILERGLRWHTPVYIDGRYLAPEEIIPMKERLEEFRKVLEIHGKS